MSENQNAEDRSPNGGSLRLSSRVVRRSGVKAAYRNGDVRLLSPRQQKKVLRYFVLTGRTGMVREAGEKMGLRFGDEIRERRFPRPFTYWPLRWVVAPFAEKRIVYEGEHLIEDTPQIHRTIRFWRNAWNGLKLGAVTGLIGGLVAWHFATVDDLGESRMAAMREAFVAEVDENEAHLIRGIRLPYQSTKEGLRKTYAERILTAPGPQKAELKEEMGRELEAVTGQEEAAVQEYRTRATAAAREAFEATRDEARLSDAELRRKAGREAAGWNLETMQAAKNEFPVARTRALQIAAVAALLPLLSAVVRRRVRAGAAVAKAIRKRKKSLRAQRRVQKC